MKKQRRRTCGPICHRAKSKTCRCICGGNLHGEAGALNREVIRNGGEQLLEKFGIQKGKDTYIDQPELPE